MKATTNATLIADIRHWLLRSRPNQTSTAALLRRFVEDRDETAFAALIDEHGPMVLGVARRVVGDLHTAEDVFQATFLALARRAGRLRHPDALPAWLHHTAYNIAVTALRARKRRDRAEAKATLRFSENPLDDLSSRELLAILDEELRRLPEVFRLPLLLCCLEGRSQDEAAALLGWSSGSVKGRLERGRQRLEDQLARRGLTFTAATGLLAAPMTVAGPLRQATLQAAHDCAIVSALVSALATPVREPLFGVSWKVILAVAAIGLVGLGVGFGMRSTSPPRTAATGGVVARLAAPPAGPAVQKPVARLGGSRLRIGNSAFALTRDGRTIIAVAPEGILRTFDANTGRLLQRRQLTDRHDVSPMGQCRAQLSADGQRVAIDEKSGSIYRVSVWDVRTGKMIFRLTPAEGISYGHWDLSSDGKQLAIKESTENRNPPQTLRVYDLTTRQGKDLGPLLFNTYDVRFTADGKRVLTSETSSRTGAKTFACFDVAAGKQLWRLPRKGQEFAISPDGKMLLSAVLQQGERGFQVIEIDPDSGKPTDRFKACDEAHPNVSLVIGPDNRTVIMAHFHEIILWDLRAGREIRRFAPKRRSRGYGPEIGAVSPDGRTLLTNLGYLQRWDLTTGKPTFAVPPDEGLGGPIERLIFTADGKEVFASSFSLESARWNVATRKQVNFVRARYGRQVVSTPAGLRTLEAGSNRQRNEIKLIDPGSGKALHTVRWAEPNEIGINGLRAYTLSADGKTLLVAHGDEPKKEPKSYVTACDVASGRRLGRLIAPGNFYYLRPPFSPCGRWAVLAGKVCHAGAGKELFTPKAEPGDRFRAGTSWRAAPVWFSEDGRLLAAFLERKAGKKWVHADTLAVWELASGKVLARFPKAEFVCQVVFAPDGRTIALLDGRGVHVHDLLSGKRLAEYPAPDVSCDVTHRGCGSQTLAFAPIGRTLATGHRDGIVRLWQVPPNMEHARKEATQIEREKWWADLRSDSPLKARTAVAELTRSPGEAVALLKTRFRPTRSPQDRAIAACIKDLDSDVFATREEATRKLRACGDRAEPALRRELAGSPSLEVKLRVERILAAITPPLQRMPLSGAVLRGVRAIEVLEWVGTPQTRALLQAWAEQSADLRLAGEARVALERPRLANSTR